MVSPETTTHVAPRSAPARTSTKWAAWTANRPGGVWAGAGEDADANARTVSAESRGARRMGEGLLGADSRASHARGILPEATSRGNEGAAMCCSAMNVTPPNAATTMTPHDPT